MNGHLSVFLRIFLQFCAPANAEMDRPVVLDRHRHHALDASTYVQPQMHTGSSERSNRNGFSPSISPLLMPFAVDLVASAWRLLAKGRGGGKPVGRPAGAVRPGVLWKGRGQARHGAALAPARRCAQRSPWPFHGIGRSPRAFPCSRPETPGGRALEKPHLLWLQGIGGITQNAQPTCAPHLDKQSKPTKLSASGDSHSRADAWADDQASSFPNSCPAYFPSTFTRIQESSCMVVHLRAHPPECATSCMPAQNSAFLPFCTKSFCDTSNIKESP